MNPLFDGSHMDPDWKRISDEYEAREAMARNEAQARTEDSERCQRVDWVCFWILATIIGAAIGLPFAGVHVVEATKQVYRPVTVRQLARRRVLAPEPTLAPTTRRERPS